MRYCHIIAAFIFVISFNANSEAVRMTKKFLNCNKSRIKISQRFYTHPKLLNIFEGVPGNIFFQNNSAVLTNGIASGSEEWGTSTSEMMDAFENKLYSSRTGEILAYIKKTKSVHRVSPNISKAKFVLTFDRRAIIVIDPSNGAVYLFNSHMKVNIQNYVMLKSLPQLGVNIASIAIHPLDGRMILARHYRGKNHVYILNKLSVDPCHVKGNNDEAEFKDKYHTNLDAILLSHRGNTLYDNYCNRSNPQCKNIAILKSYIDSKFSQLFYTHKKIVANLKNENKQLEEKIKNITALRDTSLEAHNNINEISQLMQSTTEKDQTIKDADESLEALVSGRNGTLSFFNTNVLESTITANKIDEFSRRNYECILKSEMKQFKQNMTALEAQIEYLFFGVNMMKEALDDKMQGAQVSQSNLQVIESIFDTNNEDSVNDYDEVDESELAVSEDNPFEILESIDVRFGGND